MEKMRISAFLEMSWVLILVLAQIWIAGSRSLLPTAIALIIIAARWSRDNSTIHSYLKMVGLVNSRWSETEKFLSATLLLAGSIALFSVRLGQLKPERLIQGPGAKAAMYIGSYFFWALVQQLILNGYLTLRLASVVKNRTLVAALAGMAFAIAHAPNVFLMITTLVGGAASSVIFMKMGRGRNLYVLAFFHAVIGVLLYRFIPRTITHHLVVGPRYFKT